MVLSPGKENGSKSQTFFAYPAKIMDRIDELRALVVAVDRGGLSAAGRALGRSPASITRAVASLEHRLGAALLQRTTRSLRLTEAGERYIVVARRVLADLDEAEKATGESHAEPQGTLTITAPLAFGSLHVRPIVDAFLAAHESVRARLLLLDRVVGLVDEGVDVAVRIAHLADSALVAIGVGTVRRLVVASPQYLRRAGRRRPQPRWAPIAASPRRRSRRPTCGPSARAGATVA